MKTEKVVISFVAALFGLIVAFVAFYFYQSSKVIPPSKITLGTSTQNKIHPTPTPDRGFYLTVSNPQDESVVSNKTIEVSGMANPSSVIVSMTPTDKEVVSPSQTGAFSISTTIGDGANIVEVTAISPTGEEQIVSRTITYSTEQF